MSIKLKGDLISQISSKELRRLLDHEQPAKIVQKINKELRKRDAK